MKALLFFLPHIKSNPDLKAGGLTERGFKYSAELPDPLTTKCLQHNPEAERISS